jgi:hypothetical protein
MKRPSSCSGYSLNAVFHFFFNVSNTLENRDVRKSCARSPICNPLMFNSSAKVLTLAAAAALATACGGDHKGNVLAPTGVDGGAPSAITIAAGTPNRSHPSSVESALSLLGSWASDASPGNPSSCHNFQWEVTTQTANSMSGTFSLQCPGGVTVSGNASGQLNGDQVPITATGTASLPGFPRCSFSLSGTGTIVDDSTLTIPYSGSTCLGPMSGTETLRKRTETVSSPPSEPEPPPPAPEEPPPPPPPSGPGHVGPGELSEDRAKQVIVGTYDEFPHLSAVMWSESDAVGAADQLLLRTIWHLQIAGFQTGRQRNPSNALSSDKLTILINGGWHAYDIYSLGVAGRGTTVHFLEVWPASPVPNGGIPDGQ